MPIPSYMTIVEKLFTELNVLLNDYVFHGYNALVAYLKVPLGLAMVLYIVLMGLSITQGWMKLSMGNLVKSSLKLGAIYLAIMNWGWFNHTVVGLISSGAGQIGDVLVNATPLPLPHSTGGGIYGAMQSVLIEFTQIGTWVWDRGSSHAFGPRFNALLIWGFGYALIMVALFELILAKIMLAVLFAIAPLFVGFTLFKPTQGFFDRWLGACVGFGLLTIFVSSMLTIALCFAQWAIAGTFADHAEHLSLVGFVPVMIVGFMGIGIILKAAQLAQSIGSAVTTSSGSSLLAGTIGGAVGSALSTVKMPVSAVGEVNSATSAMNAIRKNLIKPRSQHDKVG